MNEGQNYKERLIIAILALFVYGFMFFPLQTALIVIALILLYLLSKKLFGSIFWGEVASVNEYRREKRQNALDSVRIYLSPYKSIWKDLKISNKYCSLRLGSDGVSITGTEKVKNSNGQYRTFSVVRSHVHTNEDLWEMFCLTFDHLTSYNGLLELCNRYRVTIRETVRGGTNQPNYTSQNTAKSKESIEKTDVNNASEVELTALPGISIVMSKKIIKKREEIGGFKNINEFFVYIKLKPHMENQLRNLVCANKMKGSLKIERNQERSVDL